MSSIAGRPLKYKTVTELDAAIEAYFSECETKKRPPTTAGLAYALGFEDRRSLLNYEGRKQFYPPIKRAKLRIEAYTEGRLYDRDGVNGAKFSLTNNFKGWKNNPDSAEGEQDALSRLDSMLEEFQNAVKSQAD